MPLKMTQMHNFDWKRPSPRACIGNICCAQMRREKHFTLTVALVCFQLTLGAPPRTQLDQLSMRKAQQRPMANRHAGVLISLHQSARGK